MIKPMKLEDTPFANSKYVKYDIFKKDILEIIKNKIEYCELVDFPYSSNTAVNDLEYRACNICREVLYKTTGKNFKDGRFFMFTKKVENEIVHFYAYFNVSKWEETLVNGKE